MNYKNYKDYRAKYVGGSFTSTTSADPSTKQNEHSVGFGNNPNHNSPEIGDIILNNITKDKYLNKLFGQCLLNDKYGIENIPYKTEKSFTSIFDADKYYENTLNGIVDEAIHEQKGGSEKINQKGGAFGDDVPYNVLKNEVLKTDNIVKNISKIRKIQEYFCGMFFQNVNNANTMSKVSSIISFMSKLRNYANVDPVTGRIENLLDHGRLDVLHPNEQRNQDIGDMREPRVGYSESEFTTIYGQHIVNTEILFAWLPQHVVYNIKNILSLQDKNADKLFIGDAERVIAAIHRKNQDGHPEGQYYFSDVYYLEKNTERLIQDGLTNLLLNYEITSVHDNDPNPNLVSQTRIALDINNKRQIQNPNFRVTRGNVNYVKYLLVKVHSNLVEKLELDVANANVRAPEHQLIFKGGNACKYYMKSVYDDSYYNVGGFKYMADDPNNPEAVRQERRDFYTDLSDFDFDVILTGQQNKDLGEKIKNDVLNIFRRVLNKNAYSDNMDTNSSADIERLCQNNIIELQAYKTDLWKVAHKILEFYNGFQMNDNLGRTFKDMVANGICCFNEILNDTLREYDNGRNRNNYKIDCMHLNVIIGNVHVQVSDNDRNVDPNIQRPNLPGMNPPVSVRLNPQTYCSCDKKQQLVTQINGVDMANPQNVIDAFPNIFNNAQPNHDPVQRDKESVRGDVYGFFNNGDIQSIFSFIMLENVGGCSYHRNEYLLEGFDLARSNIRVSLTSNVQHMGYLYEHRLTSKAEVFDYGMSNILSSPYITMSNDHEFPKIRMHGIVKTVIERERAIDRNRNRMVYREVEVVREVSIPTKSPRYILVELITLFVFVIDAKRYKRLIRILTILDNILKCMSIDHLNQFFGEEMVQAIVNMYIKLNRRHKPAGWQTYVDYFRAFLGRYNWIDNLPKMNYLDMLLYIQTDGLCPNNRRKYLESFFKYAGVPDNNNNNQRQLLIESIRFNAQNDATNIEFIEFNRRRQRCVNGIVMNPNNSQVISSLLICMIGEGADNTKRLEITVTKNGQRVTYKSSLNVVDVKNVLVL